MMNDQLAVCGASEIEVKNGESHRYKAVGLEEKPKGTRRAGG